MPSGSASVGLPSQQSTPSGGEAGRRLLEDLTLEHAAGTLLNDGNQAGALPTSLGSCVCVCWPLASFHLCARAVAHLHMCQLALLQPLKI